MIPHLSPAGKSFRGIYLYIMHDPDASTNHRVEWTHTINMITQDPSLAWKVMAYTAIHQNRLKEASGIPRTGRPLQYPALHLSLSWHPEQNPDQEEMLSAARRAIAAIGLEDHEALIVSHNDTDYKHCHMLVSRIHPVTGLAAKTAYSLRKLSAFALKWEREGGKIYCHQRKESHDMRQQGKNTKYIDPVLSDAWRNSRNGREFKAALEQSGYRLAKGRRRIVAINRHQRVLNPTRYLDLGPRPTAVFKAKLIDLDLEALPDAEVLRSNISFQKDEQPVRLSQDHERWKKSVREAQERHRQKRLELVERHHEMIRAETSKLSEFYQLHDMDEAVSNMKRKCSQQSWWRRLLGLAKRDRAELDGLMQRQQNAKSRIAERKGQLERHMEFALRDLREAQIREIAAFERNLAMDAPIAMETSVITERTDAPVPQPRSM